MKIRMLGTGYGESKIKKKALRDFRRRGGVIIDERFLFDAPHDIFDVADDLGFADMFDDVKNIFITHSHEGHFSPEVIARLANTKTRRVFATDSVLSLIPDNEKIEKVEILPYITIEIGNYKILPLPANHETENPSEVALNFLISSDKTLFYALDGGFINNGAAKFLSASHIDAAILDCALELKEHSFASLSHNNLDMVKAIRKILSDKDGEPRVVLSHIPSDKKRSVHEELSTIAEDIGMTVAYDGYFWSI